MNEKILKIPLSALPPNHLAQNGNTRYTDGYLYVVQSEIETFSDHNQDYGVINLRSGTEIMVKKPDFVDLVDALISGKAKVKKQS